MIERLLVVEDDASVRTTVTTFLELEGYRVDAVATTSAAIRRMGESAYSIVITDIYLDERTGLDVLAAARARVGIISRAPPVALPRAPGFCTLWVASKTTGQPVLRRWGKLWKSTTRLP